MTTAGNRDRLSLPSNFRHFAFISFVNENTALEVLRQHAMAPLTFQNRQMVLAPAYKKHNMPSLNSK